MAALVIRADARQLPLPDASVDLIVTSPPYYGLRSYTDGGEHYDGQVGGESTPAAYVDALTECTREWIRVLKPSGSLFVNLGDKYSQRPGQYPSGNAAAGPGLSGGARNADHVSARRGVAYTGMQPKSLIGLPWRYALRCIDDLGLILRAEIIWSKLNGLPESVSDRVRRSHETWFHLVREPRYYAAVDEIREPSNPHNLRPSDLAGQVAAKDAARRRARNGTVGHVGKPLAFNPLGKLPGSVWEVASEPLRVPVEIGVDHFAAFPTGWPRQLILGWSPSGICTACGEGRRPVTTPTGERGREPGGGGTYRAMKAPGAKDTNLARAALVIRAVTGEACGCPDTSAPSRPAVVLDPFGGTGTSALVAHALGRLGISVDRSADYCRIAAWRTTDPAQIAKAMRVEKPPVELSGQLDLLALAAARSGEQEAT